MNTLYVKTLGDYLSDQNKDNLTDKIWKLKKKIQNKLLNEWKESKSYKNRIWEVIITYLVFLSFHVIVYGIIRNDIFDSDLDLDMIYIIFCLYLYITESAMIASIAFTVIELLYHYQFASFILNLLGQQFEAENIEDIVSWWQLRKFYLECIIDIYGKGVEGWVGNGLIGFAILSAFGFLWSDAPESLLVKWVFYGFAIAVMIFTLFLTSEAVSVYTAQLSHVFTLKRERLRLKCIDYNDDMEIFDEILDDVTENTKPMKVFGLKMVPEFMIFLQTTAITVALAAAFS